jgi:hypothetical protein
MTTSVEAPSSDEKMHDAAIKATPSTSSASDITPAPTAPADAPKEKLKPGEAWKRLGAR